MKAISLLALAFVLLGCPTVIPPAEPPAPETYYIQAPFESVWPRVVGFFADSRVPIQTIDKSSGIIASSQFELPASRVEQWIDCGMSSDGVPTVKKLKDINNFPRVLADFNVFIVPGRDSTGVRVNLGASATARAPGGIVPVKCVSSGAFERALVAHIGQP